jgi:hypothetical protein
MKIVLSDVMISLNAFSVTGLFCLVGLPINKIHWLLTGVDTEDGHSKP